MEIAAAAIIAIGAAISCFGALNGWILIVGQLPLAVAKDGLFPSSSDVSPCAARRRSGCSSAGLLATALIAMNYTRGLVALFTFIILLSTLSTLVPYVFCSLAVSCPSTRTLERSLGRRLPRTRARQHPGHSWHPSALPL